MQIVFLFAFLTHFFIAIVSFFVWRGFREERCFLYWSASALIQAIGWAIFPQLDPQQSVVGNSIAETIVFTGHIFGYIALVSFSIRKITKAQITLWCCLILAFLLFNFGFRIFEIKVWDGVVVYSIGQ